MKTGLPQGSHKLGVCVWGLRGQVNIQPPSTSALLEVLLTSQQGGRQAVVGSKGSRSGELA